MKPSIKTISEMTGFSPATVSNALNHKYGVKQSTVEAVFEAAEAIGYVSSPKISKIRFVSFKKNGLIIDDNPFFRPVIEGVEKQAKVMGYETIFSNLDAGAEGYQEQVKYFIEDTGTALILLGTEMTEADYKLFEHAKCPMILLDGWSDTIMFDSVLISNTDSACKAVEHLIEKGHQDIGYLRGNFRIKAFSQRSRGFRRALVRNNLTYNPSHIFTIGTTMETAYKDMCTYLEKPHTLPSALFADNDVIALGAMRALKEKGYKIPDDVSIIGFDNLQFGEVCTPRLSTIHVYRQEMGEIAVRRLLVDQIKLGSKIKTKIQVCTDFVERESVRDLNA